MEVVVSKRRIPKEWLGAFKEGHRKTAREFVDQDYVFDLLNRAARGDLTAREALDWITKFNNEHYKCVFKKDKTDFHLLDSERKTLMRNEWYRRRDVMINTIDVEIDQLDFGSNENAIIELMDLKKEQAKAKKQ